MHRRQFTQSLLVGGLAATCWPCTSIAQLQKSDLAKVATGRRAVAATVHPLATQAAMSEFRRGGNAIDAAVAASLMLSVVDIHNSGLGGGGLALIRTPKGEIFALDGRERAPLAASPETYIRNGQPDPSLSQTGPLASGTPGLVALLDQLSKKYGTLGWKGGLTLAAEVAARGFPIDAPLARNLTANSVTLKKFPESARVLLKDSGEPWAAGETLVQTDLANTLECLAQEGSDWFYRGPFAQATAKLMKASGGLLTAEDFRQYYVANRPPIECVYRGHRVVGFPPPSSGGIHIAQMLTMLSGMDVKSIFAESPARGLHLLAEVMKRAMADRAHWLGDADFAPVPRTLLDANYLSGRAASIDLKRSSVVQGHGQPPNSSEDLFAPGKHTTHLTTADAEGYVVALTQTVNTSFGSKMMVPGCGVLLNNEMDDFSLAPGVRNAFGLVGSAANAVAPGKRPLSSMSPTIVLDGQGQFELSCGAAGGPKIITTTLQNLVRVLDLGQTIDAALASPRVHHQWSPDLLAYEDSLPADIAQQFASMGHQLDKGKTLAVAQGITRNSDGSFTAASDPRVPSQAAAV
ncbi:MAG: gamma-glutamyltransferase [Pirellulaceae bacterium]|nr:gamma-glutamyltransferase [Pirellulaceae bacterium]